jgi:hypothetical protein
MVAKLLLPQYKRNEVTAAHKVGRVDFFIEGGTDFSKKFYFRDADADGQLTIPRDISTVVWTSKIYSPNTTFQMEYTLQTEDNSDGQGIIDTLVVTLDQAQTTEIAKYDRLTYDIDADTKTGIKGYIWTVSGWYDSGAGVVY